MQSNSADTDLDILIKIITGYKNANQNLVSNYNEPEAATNNNKVNVIDNLTSWCLKNFCCPCQ